MSTLDGWDGYRADLYLLGMKMHFRKKSGDFNFIDIMHNQRINYLTHHSYTTFQNRMNMWHYEKAASTYKRDDFVKLVVGNIIYNTSSAQGAQGLQPDQLDKSYLHKLVGSMGSLMYNFKNDVSRLLDGNSFEELFDPKDPKILTKRCTMETITIINSLTNFVDVFDVELKDDYLWRSFDYKIKKYETYIAWITNYNRSEYRDYLIGEIKNG
jgi:hypothetical protein